MQVSRTWNGRRHRRREAHPVNDRLVMWPSSEYKLSLLPTVANSVNNVSTSPKLDHGCNQYHDKYQSSSQSKEKGDASKRRFKSSSEGYGRPTRRIKDKSWTRREKDGMYAFLLLDDLTKFRRAESFVRRFPGRVAFELLLTYADARYGTLRKNS